MYDKFNFLRVSSIQSVSKYSSQTEHADLSYYDELDLHRNWGVMNAIVMVPLHFDCDAKKR